MPQVKVIGKIANSPVHDEPEDPNQQWSDFQQGRCNQGLIEGHD